MHDPFRETDPKWQRPTNSIECELVENVRDYIQSPEAQGLIVRQRPPAPTLPRGMTLNELNPGRWCLVYPDGASGYRAMEGSREELIDVASRLTTK
jgi:hypothetical protein